MTGTDTLRSAWAEHLEVAATARSLLPDLERLADQLCDCLGRGGKLIVFGNGGSAADAQHFAGELMGRFRAARRPLPAIALTTDPSVLTGIANDFAYDDVFARQVEALASADDVVIGITTSGRSENVVRGLRAAGEAGAVAVAWTGADPGPAAEVAQTVIAVPSRTAARVQEVHTLALHAICVAVDAWASRDLHDDERLGPIHPLHRCR